jgi:hypothetical protein
VINALAGLLFSLLGANEMQRGPRARFYLATGRSRMLLQGRFGALTIGDRVLFLSTIELHDQTIRRHELVHVEQWKRLGALRFLVKYIGEYLQLRRAGRDPDAAYHGVSFELDAYEGERDSRLPTDP